MKSNFSMWLDIHRSNKFTQSFQVSVIGMPGNPQSYTQ